MTREEYKQAVLKRWPTAYLRSAFPKILADIAVELFRLNDFNSELAQETRRRLNQLNDNGITDP